LEGVVALVKCVECKKEISSSVKVCPHCGKKDPTIGAKEKFIGFIILVLMVIFVPQFCSDSEKKQVHTKNGESNQIVSKITSETLDKKNILYEQVKKLPASNVEKNRDAYKKLLELNPSNQLYRDKYNYYNKLAENKKSEMVSDTNGASLRAFCMRKYLKILVEIGIMAYAKFNTNVSRFPFTDPASKAPLGPAKTGRKVGCAAAKVLQANRRGL
jgi:RNA polymerase subunit RPABC4/transcription elongation factor Spt4